MPGLFVPEPFTEDIMEKARKMRSTIALPSCFDSPYFLARFLRAHGGDEEVVKTKVEEYFSHREVLGYTGCSDMEMFTEFPIGKATFERFTISLMSRSILSGDVHVFLQKMDGTDLKEIMKVIPLSYVLHSYYMLHDMFVRAVVETEKKIGRPSAAVCILDLKGMNVADFLNPLAAAVQLSRLVVKIYSEYFCENMCKILIIRPPAIMSLMFKITKFIMDARTLNRLHFLDDVSDLHKYLEPQFEIVRREAGKEVKVWPKLTLTSLKLPEFGSVTVIPGEYVVRFRNPSSTWFAVKVTGAAEIKAE
ncbi:CRAL/TRIO domain protein [Trichostrongylus colubriformis]|uniref:CRAL/TRIO domain protein n=1 Tax=Trichostrongylus colubriformis TaxID=6319 RepID=A0AAN8IN68_TRICO